MHTHMYAYNGKKNVLTKLLIQTSAVERVYLEHNMVYGEGAVLIVYLKLKIMKEFFFPVLGSIYKI